VREALNVNDPVELLTRPMNIYSWTGLLAFLPFRGFASARRRELRCKKRRRAEAKPL